MTDQSLAERQRAYLATKQADPLGFLRNRPDFGKDGFDLDTGRFATTRLSLEFGVWDPPEELAGDQDLQVLKAIHSGAIDGLRDMVDVISQVAADDDPSLNSSGRLKTVARIIEPKLQKMGETAERQFGLVRDAIEREEAQIAAETRKADPIEIAGHHSIREHWLRMDASTRTVLMQDARSLDRVTLQALATMPAYLSGLSEQQHAQAAEALAEAMAPQRTKRVRALRAGVATAGQALQALERKAHRLIDFKQARALLEREAKRA